tara:strand:- start:3861 stop:4403 length:543 start_codon:yes stop_codon:yes gene_type:complete
VISRLTALMLIIFLSPLLFLTSVYIFFSDGTPIFFKQKRAGKNDTFFYIYKFRTMKKDTPDIPSDKLEFNPFYFGGNMLRKLSIDEIPQLINIVKGEMNFIGPRPALHNQDYLILKRKELNINYLKPGITGWAQINGRDKITENEKIELDHYYALNKSLKLDLEILLKTFIKVLSIKDIN